jgi:hypothetical protein
MNLEEKESVQTRKSSNRILEFHYGVAETEIE